jgi:hypothetical protein
MLLRVNRRSDARRPPARDYLAPLQVPDIGVLGAARHVLALFCGKVEVLHRLFALLCCFLGLLFALLLAHCFSLP